MAGLPAEAEGNRRFWPTFAEAQLVLSQPKEWIGFCEGWKFKWRQPESLIVEEWVQIRKYLVSGPAKDLSLG